MKQKKKRIINKIITIMLLIFIFILFGTIIYLNIFPISHTLFIFLLIILISFGLILCNFNKIRIIRLIGYFFSILIIISSLIIEIYLCNTLGFLYSSTNGGFIIKNYNVIVLKNSSYNDIKDLKNKTIGLFNADKDLIKKINKTVTVEYNDINNKEDLIDNLINNINDAIILEDSELSLIEENNKEIYEKIKSIKKIEIKKDISNLKDEIDINKESFNIFISGIDTYGSINAVSRSDVNILMTVNPNDEKILITWIPRDYYVDINKSLKDKLTHAGMYGIDTSIYAIENLLNVNINYYIKVNFSSVIKVIDILKGIEVYNDETFTTNENITFEKGNITLNGEQALSFVRDRKHVTGGDLGRGKNQVKILKAVLNKALSKELLKNYNNLLKALDGTFVTNIDQSTIFSFVKRELLKKRNWQIESNILTGTDGREYTYSVSNKTLYVMLPDEQALNQTKEKIKEVLE